MKISSRSFGPLTELLTEDVDSETIWEEIQTRNRPVIRYCKKEIAKSLKNEVDNTVENESESDGNEIVKGAEEYSESGIDSEESFAGSGENESGKSAIDNHNFELNLRQREDALLQDSMSDDSASIDAPMGDEEEDEMEKFLDHADDLEEKFLRKVELLEKKSKGHRGLLEVRNFRLFGVVVSRFTLSYLSMWLLAG